VSPAHPSHRTSLITCGTNAFLHAGWNHGGSRPHSTLPGSVGGPKHLATAIDESRHDGERRDARVRRAFYRLDDQDSVGVLREVMAATSRWSEVAAQRNIPEVEI